MNSEIEKNIRSCGIWVRGLYMLLFALIYSVARIVVAVVAIAQFLFVLISGETNRNLLQFGQGLSTYIYQITQFFTFNSEQKPFPFDEWPSGPPETMTVPEVSDN